MQIHRISVVFFRANLEIEKVRKVTTAEVARLEAALKKSELKISGLERSLDQKVGDSLFYRWFNRVDG